MTEDRAGRGTATETTFGALLAQLRTSIHLTQRQAARLFHISEDNYAHYEHNRRTPDRERFLLFLRDFRRQYPTVLTSEAARRLLRAYDPVRPVTPDEWAGIFPAGGSPTLAPPRPAAWPSGLEPPEGTMDPDSAFYVERPSDALARATITHPGVTITIKGPRQMGKSSLLYRTLQAATGLGKRTVLLDFQLVDQAALADADGFMRQFCAWLTHELGLEDRVAATWRLPLGPSQRGTTYLKKELLPQVGGPLVLAMDEVDRLFDTPFRSDFFGMLRSWHNSRQTGAVWKNLDLVLVTSTEPYQFVANLNQSPFNVGCVIELEDFTRAEVDDLNARHGRDGRPPFAPAELDRLLALVGGQPYLVRRALYLTATGQLTPADLFARAADEHGPFGDHLRAHLGRLHEVPALLAGLRRVLAEGACADEQVFFRLRGAGLVRRQGAAVVPRYALYAEYFHARLG